MPRSIPRFLIETADRIPEKNAVVTPTGAKSFAELQRDAQCTAEALRELGVSAGDRVGVCMEKSLDQAIVILGILFANAVLVPILPRLKEQNIDHIVTNSEMAALIVDEQRIGEVRKFSERVRLIVGHGRLEEQWPNLAYLRRFIEPSYFFDRIGADNAAIIYSSGSTGRPKGILISHRNLADGAEIVAEYLETKEADRIAGVLSLNFDYGLNQLWQVCRFGCSLHLHDFAFPQDLFGFLANARINALPVMPVIISQMFHRGIKINTSNYDFGELRYVCSTGGRLSPEMIENLTSTFPSAKIYSMFGLTEAFRGTYLRPEKIRTHPKSIGMSIPDCQVMVLDEDGRECEPNEIGELVQRGATVTKGYWNDPENTARVFRAHPAYPGETIVYSGDAAYRDDDGYLYFAGRRDEMIKTRGFRVSPTEIEEEAAKHPRILGAVALAIPNVEVGEDIGCAYITDDGEPLADGVLLQYFKNCLPNHMVPKYFLHFGEFPLTGNEGKYDRKSVKVNFFERLGMSDDAGGTGSKMGDAVS